MSYLQWLINILHILPRWIILYSVMDGGRGVETFVTIFKADNCSLFSGCRFGCGGGVLTSHMHTASLLVTIKHNETKRNESSQCLKFHNHGEAFTTSSSWFKVPNCFRHYALTQRSRDNLFYTNCLSLRTLLVLVTQFSDGSFQSLKQILLAI